MWVMQSTFIIILNVFIWSGNTAFIFKPIFLNSTWSRHLKHMTRDALFVNTGSHVPSLLDDDSSDCRGCVSQATWLCSHISGDKYAENEGTRRIINVLIGCALNKYVECRDYEISLKIRGEGMYAQLSFVSIVDNWI